MSDARDIHINAICQGAEWVNGLVFSGADCNRFQFECSNKDRLSLSECIAVYDRCNAISQCRDESDELLCSDRVSSVRDWLTRSQHPAQNVPDTTDGRRMQLVVGYDVSNKTYCFRG